MLDKISSVFFVDYPSISHHKSFLVYFNNTITDKSFLLLKKYLLVWDKYKMS